MMPRYLPTTYLAASLSLAVFMQGSLAMGEERYHAVTLLDLNNPLPPAWLQKAGIA